MIKQTSAADLAKMGLVIKFAIAPTKFKMFEDHLASVSPKVVWSGFRDAMIFDTEALANAFIRKHKLDASAKPVPARK